MILLSIALLMLAGLVTMLDWRKGLLMCVLVGVAQDPLRKLAPGQPVYYVLLVGVIFAITWVRAALSNVALGPSVIHGWRRNLKTPASLFMIVVVLQAFHSYVSYSSLVVPGIGLLVWVAPIPAIVLAYQFAVRRGLPSIRRWMILYSAVAFAALSGVYLEYAGYESRLLGEVGEGVLIYDVGTVLKAHAGFFRSSEIAAWHTAAVACFVFTLSLGKKPTLIRVLGAVCLIGALVSLGVLTGRRKMLMEITLFVSCYLFLVAWLQRGMARLAMIALMMGLVGYVVIVGFVAPDLVKESATKRMQMENAQRIEGYAVRGSSVFADLPKRVADVGVQPLVSAVEEFGWLGAGLGTGSQGTQAALEPHGINRWMAEGGLGKLTMELGVPGLLVCLWLIAAFGKHLGAVLPALAKASPPHARMAFCLLSFLIANAATFSIATQAYSDLFILLIMGCCVGFLLALPVLAARSTGQAQNRPSMPTRAAVPGTQPAPPLARPATAMTAARR